MMSRDHVKDDLGAFVLGALEPAEEERVRSHLADCDQCRREHDRLAAVAPALALLQRPREARASLPPILEEEVMRGLARERGTPARASGPGWRDALGRLAGRSAVAGALVGCAATIVVLAIGGAFSGKALPTQTVDLSSPRSPASASARLAPVASGSEVRLRARGLPPTTQGEIYEVWLVRGDARVSAGTFTTRAAEEVNVTLTTAARPAAYDRIGITLEPDGADPARNGPNVLASDLRGE